MQSVVLVVLICSLGVIAVAGQVSLAGILSGQVGLIGNGIIVFGGWVSFCACNLIVRSGGSDESMANYPLVCISGRPTWHCDYQLDRLCHPPHWNSLYLNIDCCISVNCGCDIRSF